MSGGYNRLSNYFSLPGTDFVAPTCVDDKELALGIVEIGCRTRHRSRQIRKKKKLIQGHLQWSNPIPFSTRPTGTLLHFSPGQQKRVQNYDGLDVLAGYVSIPDHFFSLVSLEERRQLERAVVLQRGQRLYTALSLVERIFETKDSDLLYHVLNGNRRRGVKEQDPYIVALRGTFAELVGLKTIEELLLEGMSLHGNPGIKFHDGRRVSEMEIDAIIAGYGPHAHMSLVQRLHEQPYLQVSDIILN